MTEQEFRQHFIEHTNKTTFAVKCEVAAQVFQALIAKYMDDKGECAQVAWNAAGIFMAAAHVELEKHYTATLQKPSHHAVHERS
jgi:hypothetical protein